MSTYGGDQHLMHNNVCLLSTHSMYKSILLFGLNAIVMNSSLHRRWFAVVMTAAEEVM